MRFVCCPLCLSCSDSCRWRQSCLSHVWSKFKPGMCGSIFMCRVGCNKQMMQKFSIAPSPVWTSVLRAGPSRINIYCGHTDALPSNSISPSIIALQVGSVYRFDPRHFTLLEFVRHTTLPCYYLLWLILVFICQCVPRCKVLPGALNTVWAA